MLSNLHTHTTFSDGTNTPEEYVQAAIAKGFRSLGFTEHVYTPYDDSYCMKPGALPLYLAEVERLRREYGGEIEIYTGMEEDYFTPSQRLDLDFTIGSVHYVRDANGAYHSVDYLPAMLEAAAGAMGGMRGVVEAYYAAVIDTALRLKPDIMGHLDLIAKLNDRRRFFDADSAWYHALLDQTADAVARSGCIAEVNTGGIYRGFTVMPYPGPALLQRLYARGVPVAITSDAHCVDALDYQLDEMAALLERIGYRSTVQLLNGSFEEVPLY